jgi:pSer/pThr/pTyr-binding forkhead associated (FHA) protein
MEASLTGPDGQRTDLTSNVLTIGRAPDNQLVLSDQQASSHHAEIRPDAQGFLLTDVNSRNGTFVNEQRLLPQTPRLLIPGDVIRIGETRLTYNAGSEDDATLRASTPDYGNPAYSPTVAVPPPVQPDYASYQQPVPPPYSSYQQPAPAAPNYPPVSQPDYGQPQQPYPMPAYSQPQGYPQQAPWAGAPGQFGAPPAPVATQPRTRRTGLIIGLIVLLVVIAGGIGVFAYANRSTPEKTLSAFCAALKNNDEHGAYSQFGTGITSRETEQQYAPRFSAFESALRTPQFGGLKDCTVSNVQENGSNATGSIVLSFNVSTATLPVNYTLSNENGTWKLENATLPTQNSVSR